MSRFVLSLGTALVLSTVGAQATQQGEAVLRNWKQMDKCAKQAQAAYPEYSAESNVKRDAKLKECLNAYGLPPRQP
jgi:membrane protease subunit (stomatin/prohibitin family)